MSPKSTLSMKIVMSLMVTLLTFALIANAVTTFDPLPTIHCGGSTTISWDTPFNDGGNLIITFTPTTGSPVTETYPVDASVTGDVLSVTIPKWTMATPLTDGVYSFLLEDTSTTPSTTVVEEDLTIDGSCYFEAVDVTCTKALDITLAGTFANADNGSIIITRANGDKRIISEVDLTTTADITTFEWFEEGVNVNVDLYDNDDELLSTGVITPTHPCPAFSTLDTISISLNDDDVDVELQCTGTTEKLVITPETVPTDTFDLFIINTDTDTWEIIKKSSAAPTDVSIDYSFVETGKNYIIAAFTQDTIPTILGAKTYLITDANQCQSDWFCQDVVGLNAPGTTLPCTQITAQEIVDKSFNEEDWVQDGALSCATPNVVYKPTTGTDGLCFNFGGSMTTFVLDDTDASCDPATKPTSKTFAYACNLAATCSNKCGLKTCAPTLDGLATGVTECEDVSCDCSFVLTTETNIAKTLACGDSITAAWELTAETATPEALVELVIPAGSEEGDVEEIIYTKTITDAKAVQSVSDIVFDYSYPEGTTIILRITIDEVVKEVTHTVGANVCSAQFKCLDPSDPTKPIDCTEVEFLETICNVCDDTFTVPQAKIGCFIGSELQNDSDVCETASPIAPVECSCTYTCKALSGQFEGTYVDCSLSSTWEVATTCGNIDTRPLANISHLTLDGTNIPCVAQDNCETSVITIDNVMLCNNDSVIKPACQNNLNGLVYDDCSCDAITDAQCSTTPIQYTTKTCSLDSIYVEKTEGETEFDLASIKAAYNQLLLDNGITIFIAEDAPIFDDSLTEILTTCTTQIPTDNSITCSCENQLWCWDDVNNDSTEVPTELTDIKICGNTSEDFPGCSKYCKDAGITSPSTSRPAFCRQADGTFVVAAVDDDCDTVESDLSTTCPIELDCVSDLFCQAIDITPFSGLLWPSTAVAGYTPCSDVNTFSSICYTPETVGQSITYTETLCTDGLDENILPKNIRKAQCKVYYLDSDGTTKIPVTNAVNYGNLCENQTEPSTTQECFVYSGCTPALKTLIVESEGTVVDPTDDPYTVAIADGAEFDFKYTYVGPLDTESIRIQWAYKGDASNPEDVDFWSFVSDNVITSYDETTITWTIDASTDLFTFQGETTTQDIYVRVFILGDVDSIQYPLVISLEKDASCAATNPTLGFNQVCVDTEGIGELVCDKQSTEITSTVATSTGECSRSSTCDVKAPVCKNDGYYMINGDSCASECTCPKGQSPTDQCTTCIECPISRGIKKDVTTDTSCGCASCRTGFFNGANNGICTDCNISTNIVITNPSASLVIGINGNGSTAQKNGYVRFQNVVIGLLSQLLNLPQSQITFVPSGVAATSANAQLKIQFSGDCTGVAKTPSASAKKMMLMMFQQQLFEQLATTNIPLKQLVDGYDNDVVNDGLSSSPDFSSYAMTSSSQVTSTNDFDGPLLYVEPVTPIDPTDPTDPTDPVDPTEPVVDPTKKKTNVVAIVVPVVVCGVIVIIAIILIVYFCCVKNGSGGGSDDSSSSSSSSSSAQPKSKRSSTIASDDGHLELV